MEGEEELSPHRMPKWKPQPFPGVRAIVMRSEPRPSTREEEIAVLKKRPAWAGTAVVDLEALSD